MCTAARALGGQNELGGCSAPEAPARPAGAPLADWIALIRSRSRYAAGAGAGAWLCFL